ncbi:MAG: hypothetical protein LH617_08000 [Ramlibacter sp.]|nr:hypothetical protein [Ramlibacter sp.]
MPMTRTKARLDRLIWILIYGGLFAVVLGYASRESAATTGWTLMVVGGSLSAVGVVLIWVRSRLGPDT